MSYEDIIPLLEDAENEVLELTKLNKMFKGAYETRLQYAEFKVEKWRNKLSKSMKEV